MKVLSVSLSQLLLYRLLNVTMVCSSLSYPQHPGSYSRYIDVIRLLRYTPAATSIRLLTLNAINFYLTSFFLQKVGGGRDPRRLLPAWISITCVSFPYFPKP